MHSLFQRASKLLPLVLGGTVVLSASATLPTLAQASLLLGEICLQLCQMGLVILRTCGI